MYYKCQSMNFIFKWKEDNEKNIRDVFLSKGLIWATY